LPNNRVCEFVFAPRPSAQRFGGDFRLNCLSILAALCLLAPQLAHSQESETAVVTNTPLDTNAPAETDTGVTTKTHARQPVESELIVEGEGSFGHYHIFAYTWWSELYTGGVEYDRHSWDYFYRLGARLDYVAEALPVAILRQPVKADIYGDPLSQARQLVPGAALSPIGLRMMWRSKKSIKPYFIIKGGMIVFDKKALSPAAAYQNFLLQIGIGMQARLTQRLDLRVGYADIHFSNAFMVPNNPGLDVMSYNGGLSYHFGK